MLDMEKIRNMDMAALDARRAELVSLGKLEELSDEALTELVAIAAQIRRVAGFAPKSEQEKPKKAPVKKASKLEDLDV